MFSVIIPAYNEERYLPRLLDSIKKQKVQPSEIIVADADSEDRTKEIAIKYGCKIVKGGRISVSRNNGAKVAKSNIIVFIDADTELLNEDFFNKIIGTFIKRNADVASCYFLPSDKKVKYSIPMAGVNAFKFISHKLKQNRVTGGACIISTKNAFKKVNGFNTRMRSHEDNHFFQKSVKHGLKFIIIPQFIHTSTRRFERKKLKKILFLGLISFIAGTIGSAWVKKKKKKADNDFWDDVI